TAKCAFQRHVTYFDRSTLGAARSAEGARRGRGSGGRQERAAGDGGIHSFLPASFCSLQPSRDRKRNRIVAPLRSPTAQCASLIAPYTSLAARRIVPPTAQAPRAKNDAAISPPRRNCENRLNYIWSRDSNCPGESFHRILPDLSPSLPALHALSPSSPSRF